MAFLGLNTQKTYEQMSWNDLVEVAVKRGLSVPPFRGVESYERPTPREKLISELVALDKKKWKNLYTFLKVLGVILGFIISFVGVLKLIQFNQVEKILKIK